MTTRLGAAAADFARTTLALFPVLVLVRAYELILVRARHPVPGDATLLFARGILSELAVTLVAGVVLALPVLGLALVAPRAARSVHRVVIVLIAVTAVMLAQYFALTYVPLGADFFAYSWSDIVQTTTSSGGGGVAGIAAIAVAAIASWWITGATRRVALGRHGSTAVFAAMGVALVLRHLLIAPASAFASQSAFVFSTSKTAHIAGAAIEFYGASMGDTPAVALTGYPLLQAGTALDVLGPLLQTSSERPNIVFVVVEGLGRDFVGRGARFGGFTPFLDSLTTRGLYWENFLSSSGRTFGVLPGLLGSLPHGRMGFMELGSRMPSHLTLMSILGAQGYATNYFTGGDGHFDFIDLFLERQKIDRIVDQSDFGPGYVKAPAIDGGTSWGFADADVFKRSFELLGPSTAKPRLDVYLTMTTHEPFIPPRRAEYHARFESRLATLPLDESRRAEMRRHADVFSTLLYTDDALATLVHEYEKRPEFARTILIITGDHRLIPIAEESQLDRFRVPFLIYSPMVKTPRTMSSVSSHLDVTPTLVAFLHARYGVTVPDSVAWMGTGIDTVVAFRNVHAMPFMRTKGTVDTYLDELHLLAAGETYDVENGLTLRPSSDGRLRDELKGKLARLTQLDAYVTRFDRLYPARAAGAPRSAAAVRDEAAFRALHLDSMDVEHLFLLARDTARVGDRATARVIARELLLDAPNNHDARALLGRTFAWDTEYDSARVVLRELTRRAPAYPDGYSALADVEVWSGHPAAALATADAGLAKVPKDADLLLRRVRALELLDRRRDALAALEALRAVDPSHAEGARIRARLAR